MKEQKSSVTRQSSGKAGKRLLLAAWLFLVIPYIFNMIRSGEKESEVIVTSQYVEVISGHGIRIPLEAVTAVQLKDEMPEVKRKVRGYNSFSCVKKGQFKLEGMGIGRIYIFTRAGPYLYIFSGGQFTIIAFEDPDKTRRLYEDIESQRRS